MIELKHYGVKGMKWGVRKFQKYPAGSKNKGTFIGIRPDSEKVKLARDNLQNTKIKLKKTNAQISKSGWFASKEQLQTQRNLMVKKDMLNKTFKNQKILSKLDRKGKSKTQLKMEEKYLKQGMNKEEATLAAYKNIRTKKVIAAAVVATTAYAAYKTYDHRVDKIIKKGTLIQNIANNSDKGVRDSFYGATGKLDKIKYQGIYGGTLKQIHEVNPNLKQVKTLVDIKQASPQKAQAVLKDMLSGDPASASIIKSRLNGFGATPQQIKLAQGAIKEIDSGKIGKKTYEAFNILNVDHDGGPMENLTKSFYKTMSEKGYNAIRDVNDNKYSGYKTNNPIITFNNAGKVAVTSVKQLTDAEIKKAATIGYADIVGKGAVATGVNIAITNKASNTVRSYAQKQQIINEYKQQNPNTKLSNDKILKAVVGS